MRGCLLASALFLAAALPILGVAETAVTSVFQVDYSNPGLSPSHWTMTIRPDGSGHFRSERGSLPASGEELEAPNVDRDIKVSPEFAGRVFESARRHSSFNYGCESHMKVAFQGWKKLSYSGPEGSGSCQFNYSKDKDIQDLGDSLVAVAETIVEGSRLESLLQHDRLGLDREMEFITEAAKDGRVQQINAIQGILERLANDPGVLERVRKRARVLLAKNERQE
jgi:hypothetical protein